MSTIDKYLTGVKKVFGAVKQPAKYLGILVLGYLLNEGIDLIKKPDFTYKIKWEESKYGGSPGLHNYVNGKWRGMWGGNEEVIFSFDSFVNNSFLLDYIRSQLRTESKVEPDEDVGEIEIRIKE